MKRILLPAAALLLAAWAAPAHASWNVGGGLMAVDLARQAPDDECPTGPTTVDGTIQGFAMNTVGTGGIGGLTVDGFTCDGKAHVAVYGVGPTGSLIDCPRLEGPMWHLEGVCYINYYDTGVLTLDATLAGTDEYQAGPAHIEVDTSRKLIYTDWLNS